MVILTGGVTLSPTSVVFICGVFGSLIGIIFKTMINRVSDVETLAEKNQESLNSIKQSLYGNQQDPNDEGYVASLEKKSRMDNQSDEND